MGTRSSAFFIQSGGLVGQRVTVEIPDMRAGALGRQAGLAGVGLTSLDDLRTARTLVDGDPQHAIQMIDAVINEVALIRGRVGALQNNALETASSALQVTSENLASVESRLRDVDFAAESVAFTRHQILYQAATAMLAQANQIPQSVLQMLRG